jgi:hypothetical protein
VIWLKFKFEDNFKAVEKAERKASLRNLKVTAFSIRKDTIDSIVAAPAGEASAPGSPVHTRTRGTIKSGKNKGKKRLGQVQRATNYDVDQSAMNAAIGFRASVVGDSMNAHEFGGEYKGESYHERPTIGPALDKNIDRFGNSFSYSIGE